MKSIKYKDKLRDDQWEKIAHSLSVATRINLAKQDYRLFIEAVLWVILNNKAWVDIPTHFGNAKSIYVCFYRWNERAIWQLLARRSTNDQELHRLLTKINECCDRLNRRREHRSQARMAIQKKTIVLPENYQDGVTVHHESTPDQSH